jgi:hypothetical protein
MTTITLEIPDDLVERLADINDRLPDLLSFALDIAGIPDNETSPMAQLSPAWLESVDFLASIPNQQEIVNFKLSPEAQDRLEELLHLHREGTLTPQERAELNTYRQINHLFILLKARTREALAGV